MPLFLFISNALQVHGWELSSRRKKPNPRLVASIVMGNITNICQKRPHPDSAFGRRTFRCALNVPGSGRANPLGLVEPTLVASSFLGPIAAFRVRVDG